MSAGLPWIDRPQGKFREAPACGRRKRMKQLAGMAASLLGVLFTGAAEAQDVTLLNVSYDVTRELFKDINSAFIAEWKQKTGETVTINQSHGGSGKQAQAVANGLEASVVTMNHASDIDFLADRGLVAAGWAKRLPEHAAPFYSTMVYLVRKGNPKQIRDWEDLARPGVKAIIPDPRITGNGRYTYLAAWGSVIMRGGTEAQARQLVEKIFRNVPVLDAGGRAATATFTQREIGDVLVTFENEVNLARQEFGNHFELIHPKFSILAESPVSVVDKVADRKGTRRQADAYLQFLYSEPAQEIIAKHYFRPRSPAVAQKYAASFAPVTLFTVNDIFGEWKAVQKKHFGDGGEFDKMMQSARQDWPAQERAPLRQRTKEEQSLPK